MKTFSVSLGTYGIEEWTDINVLVAIKSNFKGKYIDSTGKECRWDCSPTF